MLWLVLPFVIWTGCATLSSQKTVEETIPAEEWNTQTYARFLEQNIKMINEIYTTVYRPYHFVVDTPQGSIPVQELVDTRAVMRIVEELKTGNYSQKELIWQLYRYVVDEYDYAIEAKYWPTIGDTLEKKEGDCKGLSLLLMSLFLAAGYDAYAAISNGHMWVRGSDGSEWHTFEVDTDRQRKEIYQIKGFYENPLFKVFHDRTYKRKRK